MSNKKNNSKLVSILIACYNGEKYIYNCLTSCVNQTYKNIEIVIINDGSIDNSQKIFEWWRMSDNRIRVINNQNQGLAETRNQLIKEAKGDYFTFVDIDDNIKENTIETLISHVENEELDIVVGRTNFVYDNKIFRKIPFIPAWRIIKNMTNTHYVKSNICTPWASLIKTDFFRSLNISFIKGRLFEDLGVMTYVFLSAKKFKAIKDVIYFYQRYRQNGKTKNLSSFKNFCFKKSNDIFWQINQLLSYLKESNLLESRKYKRAVNGLLYQVIPANTFLSSNLTRNKNFRYLMNYDLVKMISSYGLYFKFSKTFWKTIAFFYIYLKNFQALRNVYKNKKKNFFINGSLKDGIGYSLNRPKNNIRRPSRTKIYEISIEEILNFSIDNYSINTNIALIVDHWSDNVVDSIKIMQDANCVPFIYLKDHKIKNEDLIFLQEETLGIIFDLRAIDIEHFKEMHKILKSTNREKVIFLVVKKTQKQDINEIKDLVNGVFWDV